METLYIIIILLLILMVVIWLYTSNSQTISKDNSIDIDDNEIINYIESTKKHN